MATLATNISFQVLGTDGKPLAGGQVFTYEAGSTTLKDTYTTMIGDTPNPNPLILDQNGKAKIFLGDGAYRIRILDCHGALVDDIDQISRYVTQNDFDLFQQTVNDGVAKLGQVEEQIEVFVQSELNDQKGFAGGVVPLGNDNKIDPMYMPELVESEVIPKASEETEGVLKVIDNANSNDSKAALSAKQGKITDRKASGANKRYVDVSSLRTAGTWYTNDTGEMLYIAFRLTGDLSASASAYVRPTGGSAILINTIQNNAQYVSLLAMLVPVPPDHEYKIDGSVTGSTWRECRKTS